MPDDYEYHQRKSPAKTYVSPSLPSNPDAPRRFRIASKVFDSLETHAFAVEQGEEVIHVTAGGRQEIVAKFYEDDRSISRLTLQRFSRRPGHPPLKTSISLDEKEIDTLLAFISRIRRVELSTEGPFRIVDGALERMLLSPDQTRTLVSQNQELVLEIARWAVTKEDIFAVGYRKDQLTHFEKLLSDPQYFSQEKRSSGATAEGVWQAFFERNAWIFGYGLTYVYLSALDNRKLEQTVLGYDFTTRGKRVDALMKTRGAIEALCFVEIKTHNTPLLKKISSPYRPECWAPSEDLSGGVAQVQTTVQKAIEKLIGKTTMTDDQGNATGEELFAYQPKSFLVIGSLDEFDVEHGVNVHKYRSFELFRRNLFRPEVITFDELYDRARFIVEHAEQKS